MGSNVLMSAADYPNITELPKHHRTLRTPAHPRTPHPVPEGRAPRPAAPHRNYSRKDFAGWLWISLPCWSWSSIPRRGWPVALVSTWIRYLSTTKIWARPSRPVAASVLGDPRPALIVWHHGSMVDLVKAIPIDNASDLPGKWPHDRFDLIGVLTRDPGQASFRFTALPQEHLDGDSPLRRRPIRYASSRRCVSSWGVSRPR